MKPGARLVIVDRTVARPDGAASATEVDTMGAVGAVDDETRRHGFEPIARDESSSIGRRTTTSGG